MIRRSPIFARCALALATAAAFVWGSPASAGTFTPTSYSSANNTNNTDYLSGKKVGIYTGPSNTSLSLSSLSTIGTPGFSGTLHQGGAFAWQGTFSGSDTAAQQIGNGSTGANVRVVAYCLQLNQGVSNTAFTTVVGIPAIALAPVGGNGTGMGTVAANYIEELWQKYYDTATTTSNGLTINSVAYTNSDLSGAFQLAIWKLEYDSNTGGITRDISGNITAVDWSGSSGAQLTSSTATNARNLATSWLTSLTAPNASNQAQVFVMESGTGQDMIIGRVVPEPASLLTWLVIGSVVGFESIRRRKKNVA